MLIAHKTAKIALDPNNKQATYITRAAGTARFTFDKQLSIDVCRIRIPKLERVRRLRSLAKNQGVVDVDLGVSMLAIFSTRPLGSYPGRSGGSLLSE